MYDIYTHALYIVCIVCVSMYGHSHMKQLSISMAEDYLKEWGPLLPPCRLCGPTPGLVIRLGCKHLYPLNYIANPSIFLMNNGIIANCVSDWKSRV